jgi:mRNA-degrading endonuclease RelE of RelBE toxin-antitoxin system
MSYKIEIDEAVLAYLRKLDREARKSVAKPFCWQAFEIHSPRLFTSPG